MKHRIKKENSLVSQKKFDYEERISNGGKREGMHAVLRCLKVLLSKKSSEINHGINTVSTGF